jgi:hypothetical protein
MKVIKRLDNTTITPFWLRPKNWLLLQSTNVSSHVVTWVGGASWVGLIVGLPTSPSLALSIGATVLGIVGVSSSNGSKNKRQKAIKKYGMPEISTGKHILPLEAGKTKEIEASIDHNASLFHVYEASFDRINPQVLELNKRIIGLSFHVFKHYKSLSAENQYEMDKVVSNIYPALMDKFTMLPRSQRSDNSHWSIMTIEQLRHIDTTITNIYKDLYNTHARELRTSTQFLRDRSESLSEEKMADITEVVITEEDIKDFWLSFKNAYFSYKQIKTMNPFA